MTIKIDLCDCRDGDILACTVFDEDGFKLVAKDTLLTDYIIKRLEECEIDEVEVYAPCKAMREKGFRTKQLQGEYKDSVVSVKNMIYDVSAGRKIEANKINSISDNMYNNFNSLSYTDIISYMKTLRTADEYTYYHSVNVAFYSMLMAQWLKLSETETKRVIQAGFLHDVGKARVPLDVLNKPASLTDEEFKAIKKHPIYGYRILEESNFPDLEIKTAVLMHHERINRTGYPFIIAPGKIGLTARIIAIADVYDAMTSDRIYKKKKTPFEAFRMFKTEGYTDFDVHISNMFVNNMSASLVGAKVGLNNGNEGKIVFIPPNNQLYPIIESSGHVFPLYQNGVNIVSML